MNKEEIDIIENLIDKYTTYIGDSLSDFEMVNGRDVALKTDLKSALLDLNTFHNQQTATLQQELDRLKNPWVKCSERPYTDMGHRVLCLCSSGSKAVGYQLNGEWTRDSDGKTFERMGYIVTHWSELPEPPQQ